MPMNTVRLLIWGAVLTTVVAMCSIPSQAIPVFARKYGFNCTMCHLNYPRLNDYGIRYRQNGYQLPGRENEERTVLESPTPVAFRTTAGYILDDFDNTPGAEDVSQFQVEGLDVLSGGLFGRNIGYIFVYPPEIKGSRGVAPQEGTLEMANVIFSNIGSTWLNIRAGRFEAAYTAFSDKRRLTFSPYEIYDFAFPSGFAFSETQSGVEITGYGPYNGCFRGLKYAVGWVDGSANDESDDAPSDFYLRGVKVFGHGEGQTSGQRLGVTGFFGKARPLPPLTGSRKSFNRWGVDASLNLRMWNLGIQYLRGHDSGGLTSTGDDFDFSGGFARVLYMPRVDLVGFARYDWVSVPGGFGIGDITRWTIGARYYFRDNIALHLEYSHRNQDSTTPGLGDATENFFTARLDFAF
jgi:hypothetical protein